MSSNFLEKLDQEKTERIIGDNDNLVQIKNEEAKRAEAVAELAVKTFQQKSDNAESLSKLSVRISKLEGNLNVDNVNSKNSQSSNKNLTLKKNSIEHHEEGHHEEGHHEEGHRDEHFFRSQPYSTIHQKQTWSDSGHHLSFVQSFAFCRV